MPDAPELELTGGCNCGAVRFRVTAAPTGASYCHCRRCQRRTGAAASPNVALAPGSLQIVTGEDRLKAWRPPDGWEKWFCGDCGSQLFSRDPGDPDRVGVRFGVLDQDPGVRPTLRQFLDSAAAWEPVPDDGLTRYPQSRPGGAASSATP